MSIRVPAARAAALSTIPATAWRERQNKSAMSEGDLPQRWWPKSMPSPNTVMLPRGAHHGYGFRGRRLGGISVFGDQKFVSAAVGEPMFRSTIHHLFCLLLLKLTKNGSDDIDFGHRVLRHLFVKCLTVGGGNPTGFFVPAALEVAQQQEFRRPRHHQSS